MWSKIQLWKSLALVHGVVVLGTLVSILMAKTLESLTNRGPLIRIYSIMCISVMMEESSGHLIL